MKKLEKYEIIIAKRGNIGKLKVNFEEIRQKITCSTV